MINGNVKYVIIDAAPAESITKGDQRNAVKILETPVRKAGARYGSLPLFDCIGTWQETLCFCYLEVLWELREQMEQVCTDIY